MSLYIANDKTVNKTYPCVIKMLFYDRACYPRKTSTQHNQTADLHQEYTVGKHFLKKNSNAMQMKETKTQKNKKKK